MRTITARETAPLWSHQDMFNNDPSQSQSIGEISTGNTSSSLTACRFVRPPTCLFLYAPLAFCDHTCPSFSPFGSRSPTYAVRSVRLPVLRLSVCMPRWHSAITSVHPSLPPSKFTSGSDRISLRSSARPRTCLASVCLQRQPVIKTVAKVACLSTFAHAYVVR